MNQTAKEGKPLLRRPQLKDGKAVHALVKRSPPLDLNSAYNYFLLCSHFAETCVVSELDGEVAGFLSAYRLPEDPQTLFIWQVAVDESLRGHGMAGRMLDEVLARPVCAQVNYIETTVSPSNRPSRRVFEHFAERRAAQWHEEVFLSREDFGGDEHEEEVLFRIGPFSNE
jgi:L-2,4-diaminobutyric acid acetyltransferase